MTAGKREPTLADLVMAGPPTFLGMAVPRDLIRNAHRFVFDRAASVMMARLGRECPDLIADQMRFAVAPHATCWIELDGAAHYREITGREPDADADGAVGYLIHNGFVRSFARSINDSRSTGMTPIGYKLHTPWPLHDRLRFREQHGISEVMLDGCLWGSSTANPRIDDPSAPYRSALAQAHTLTMLCPPEVGRRGAVRDTLGHSAGELRMILAALLLLSRPAKPARYVAVPPGRGWVGNKHRPYLSHSVVTLDLSEGPILRPLHAGTGAGTPKRHHAVRHHYAHHWTPQARGCVHDYERLAAFPAAAESDPTRHCRWECRRCATIRWRRQAHTRGTAEKGVVLTSYAVTSSRTAA